MQGLFGAFPFTVSDSVVCTFRALKESREIAYAEHKALSGLPKLQRAGRNLDTISLDILVAPAGAPTSVELRLLALQAMSHLPTALPLIIGLKYYGMYVLKSYEITRRQIHYGVVLAADVNLNLQEYN